MQARENILFEPLPDEETTATAPALSPKKSKANLTQAQRRQLFIEAWTEEMKRVGRPTTAIVPLLEKFEAKNETDELLSRLGKVLPQRILDLGHVFQADNGARGRDRDTHILNIIKKKDKLITPKARYGIGVADTGL